MSEIQAQLDDLDRLTAALGAMTSVNKGCSNAFLLSLEGEGEIRTLMPSLALSHRRGEQIVFDKVIRHTKTPRSKTCKPSPSRRQRSWFSLISCSGWRCSLFPWKGAEMDPLLPSKIPATWRPRRRLLPAGLQPVAGLPSVKWRSLLQISAVWGTALAVILSIPFGLMSAENIVPWWIYQPMPPDGRLSRHQSVGLCDAVRGRRRPGSVWRA